jgi:hypothetical protein
MSDTEHASIRVIYVYDDVMLLFVLVQALYYSNTLSAHLSIELNQVCEIISELSRRRAVQGIQANMYFSKTNALVILLKVEVNKRY